MTDKLYRSISGDTNVTAESRTVEGYAMTFEQWSDNMGFFEKIARGALTQELVDSCDVFARFDHDMNKVLARSNKGQGSLKLIVDEVGLKYSFEAPHTELGNELLEYIKRGDLNKSSFCFSIADEEGAEKWEKKEGVIYRTIYKIGALYDIAPVWVPAYSSTSCDSRKLKEIETFSKEIDDKMNFMKLQIELM